MSTGYDYIWAENQTVAVQFMLRNVENSVPYIKPVLDSLPPNFTLLDVGCGPGSITLDIARRYPSATILGIDGSQPSLDKAKASVQAAGLNNVQFMLGNALDLVSSVGESKFDVVCTHQVLLHLSDAQKGMHNLRAVVKPGGFVCCCEADLGFHGIYPEIPTLAGILDLMVQMISSKGADPMVGRKLVSMALAAGFKRDNIQAGVFTRVSSTPAERKVTAALFSSGFEDRSTSKIMGKSLQNGANFDVEAMKKAWDEWVQAEDGWHLVASPNVICKK